MNSPRETAAEHVQRVHRILREIGEKTDSDAILERAAGKLTEAEICEALRTLKAQGALVVGQGIPYFTGDSNRVTDIQLITYG